MFKRLLTFIFVIIAVTASFSQNNLLKEAKAFYDNKQYAKALNGYVYYNNSNPGNIDVLTKMGVCYYHIGQADQAQKSLRAAIGVSKKQRPETLLYLAKSLQATGDFAEAAIQYKQYLQSTKANDPTRAQVRDAIRRCGAGIRAAYISSDAIVENIGTSINTDNDDYGAVLSPSYDDRIYFSSIRPSNIGGRTSEAGNPDVKYGSFNSDVFVATVTNGSWNDVQRMENGINSAMDDHVLDFSKDGQILSLWQSKNGYSGDVLVDTFSRDGVLRRGIFKGPIEGWNGDGGLSFYNDTTILFYSNRPGGYGGTDIYAAFYDGTQWSNAYNLGPEVNSPYDEISPFLSNDGSTLYFSSNNLESMGGFDIFKSSFNVGQKKWGTAVNVGVPINSGKDDYQYRLDSKGLQAYLTSNRPGGVGGLDIYIAYFKNYQTEQSADYTIASLTHLGSNALNPASIGSDGVPQYDASQITTYSIQPIYYNQSDQVIIPENTGVIETILQILRDNSTVHIDVIGSSDEGSSAQFDLYASIKRAEDLSEYLSQQGIDQNRINVRGVGPGFPYVRHKINGQPVLVGTKINRRLDVIFKNIDGLPIKIDFKKPTISNPQFVMDGVSGLRQQAKGVSYRVRVAETPNIYMGDIIFRYPDVMIDRAPGNTLYRYTIGSYSTYQSAAFMKRDLINSGILDAKVIAFVDGNEISSTSVAEFADKHPDLKNYLSAE